MGRSRREHARRCPLGKTSRGGPGRVQRHWWRTEQSSVQFHPLKLLGQGSEAGKWRPACGVRREKTPTVRGTVGEWRPEWGEMAGKKKAATRLAPLTWQAVIELQPVGPANAV